MIKEAISLKQIKGWVKIWGIDRRGKRVLLVDQSNGLVGNAKQIICNALAGQSGYILDTIKPYKAGTALATSTSVTYTFPTFNQISINATFNEASFNDTLDELRLVCAAHGDFSYITGISVTKTNVLQLQVNWLLTINDL